ncbi:MAG: DUF3011 domain-containing protein [Xanthomonadales bacterium]|jgi:hypothetical protein|nr:DUF3011 domain-containing protein [Xanthomonadales bacterium]
MRRFHLGKASDPKRALSLLGIGISLISINVAAQPTGTVTVNCASDPGTRQHCPANTSAGVMMTQSNGEGACLLGKSWGYDDAGVWVRDGCSGQFIVAGVPAMADAVAAEHEPAQETLEPVAIIAETRAPETEGAGDVEPEPSNDTWGFLDPGKGFLIGKGELGEASLSAYGLLRYLDQQDDDGVFTDHLGRERPVDGRKDVYSHRVLVWLNGWVGVPKLRYTIAWWTVTATDQDALFANIGYQFNEHFNLYGGIFGNPGSRSMQGSHPYWLGHDRVMADEFFRPFFTQGLFANGLIVPGLYYSASMGNSSSTLGNTAAQLDRDFTYGGSVWWMPTTKEFGPRGAYGDWEMHEELATRFGVSAVYSPEERYSPIGSAPGNTALKLADSVNLMETGALVPGVTVTNADYRILALDAGMKYKGFFLQFEYYQRWLDGFKADGVLPVDEIKDNGWYLQAAFYPVPRVLELYGATSQIYGDSDAGFSDSSEYILGMNYYPFNTRNHRLNLQYINVDKSPVSSTFGYYVGGQEGNTYSAAFSIFF